MSKTTGVRKYTSKDLVKYAGVPLEELGNKDVFKSVLNNDPPEEWLEVNERFGSVNGSKYIPIGRVEILMDMIFQSWNVEVKSVFQLAQSIVAIVRVNYLNPVTGEWEHQDGVGAEPLKTDAGHNASELQFIKSDAVKTGAPSAVSYAVKDAVQHLGKLFGRDLNRKKQSQFQSIYGGKDKQTSYLKADPEKASILANLYMETKDCDSWVKALTKAQSLTDEEINQEIKRLEEQND